MGTDVQDTWVGRGECADVRELFKAFIQKFLLFGSDMWVVKPCVGRMMGGLQHRVDLQMTVKQPQSLPYRVWDYPHIGGGNDGGCTGRGGNVHNEEA